MDLKEFERQVLAGEITDFEPYFEGDGLNYHLRYVLATLGIEVDRIIDMDGSETILGFIKDKVHIDRYEEWKNHPNITIRQELARVGYFQDEYFDDPDEGVRAIVIQNNVRKALTRIRNDNDLMCIKWSLETIVEPDVDVLSTYIDKQKQQNRKYRYDDDDDYHLQASRLKLDSLSHIPTTIKDWEPSETYSEYENRWEKAVSVYTNFSGNTGRLYDVLYHMREYKDEFSREGDYTVNVSTKAELEHILDKETDDALLDKWDDIMEYLEYIDDDETLYFFTD